MIKILSFTICTLLFLSCLYVVDAGVETVSTSVDLVASSTCTIDIILNNPTNNDLELYISTEILPDSEGITITYNPSSPFILSKESTIIVEMTIDTNISLVPQQYIIETTFLYDDYYSYETIDYSHLSTIDNKDIDDEAPLPDDETDETDDEVDETDNNVLVASVIVGNHNWYKWLIFPAIILVAIISLLYYFIKKKENEKDEKHK